MNCSFVFVVNTCICKKSWETINNSVKSNRTFCETPLKGYFCKSSTTYCLKATTNFATKIWSWKSFKIWLCHVQYDKDSQFRVQNRIRKICGAHSTAVKTNKKMAAFEGGSRCALHGYVPFPVYYGPLKAFIQIHC